VHVLDGACLRYADLLGIKHPCKNASQLRLPAMLGLRKLSVARVAALYESIRTHGRLRPLGLHPKRHDGDTCGGRCAAMRLAPERSKQETPRPTYLTCGLFQTIPMQELEMIGVCDTAWPCKQLSVSQVVLQAIGDATSGASTLKFNGGASRGSPRSWGRGRGQPPSAPPPRPPASAPPPSAASQHCRSTLPRTPDPRCWPRSAP